MVLDRKRRRFEMAFEDPELTTEQQKIAHHVRDNAHVCTGTKAGSAVTAFVRHAGVKTFQEFLAWEKETVLQHWAHFHRTVLDHRWNGLLTALTRSLGLPDIPRSVRNLRIDNRHGPWARIQQPMPAPCLLREAWPTTMPVWVSHALATYLAWAHIDTPSELDVPDRDEVEARVRGAAQTLPHWTRSVQRAVCACLDTMKAHPSVDTDRQGFMRR